MANWGEITLLMGVVTPFTTGRGPTCRQCLGRIGGFKDAKRRLVTPIGDDCKGIPPQKMP